MAARFKVSIGSVRYWVARAKGLRLDRVSFDNRKPGKPANRTSHAVERRILGLRASLREDSVLGEFGPDAIREALRLENPSLQPPSRATIHRVLARHGLLDGSRRLRRPPPPKGWYLPDVASGHSELDSFDFIEDLKIAKGPLVDVLTATSLHGALADARVMLTASARETVLALLDRWRHEGLPTYAQFDNATLFQGAHQFTDSIGRVCRLCLALRVIPVFAPPREPGFQNAIEGFNALWRNKVWNRHRFTDLQHLKAASTLYISAHRTKTARRREAAPERRPFPESFTLDLDAPLVGHIIFIRRTNEHGIVNLLGRTFHVSDQWPHRLVRCHVDFSEKIIHFHALRRRASDVQPLLKEVPYDRPDKPFRDRPKVC